MDRFATTARVKYPLFTKRWIHRQHPHDQYQTKKHQSLECCALRTLSLKLCRARTRLAARPAPEDALVGRRPARGCDGRPVPSILAGSSVCICYLFRQDKYYHYLHPTLLRCTSFWPPFIYWSRAHGHMCGRACCVGWLGDKIISKWQIRITLSVLALLVRVGVCIHFVYKWWSEWTDSCHSPIFTRHKQLYFTATGSMASGQSVCWVPEHYINRDNIDKNHWLYHTLALWIDDNNNNLHLNRV